MITPTKPSNKARWHNQTNSNHQTHTPLPELARELPTLPLTHGVYIAGRSYWTVAALVILLRDGVGRMTDGDLEQVRELGAMAHEELKTRKGD
jgi:hypothetical protein